MPGRVSSSVTEHRYRGAVPMGEVVTRGENMKLLKHLLVVVIAATGVIGSARAQTPPGNTFNLGTLTPAGVSQSDSFPSGSFCDTFNFTVDASNHIVTGGVTAASNVNGSLYLLHGDPTAQYFFSGASAQSFHSTVCTPCHLS